MYTLEWTLSAIDVLLEENSEYIIWTEIVAVNHWTQFLQLIQVMSAKCPFFNGSASNI